MLLWQEMRRSSSVLDGTSSKNMDSEIGHFPLSKRDADETDFFAEGIWKQLPAHVLGIQELRGRLSNVLLRQIATELPSVISEIETKHKSCEDRLKKLGQPRTTTDEQRLYLVQISQSFQILVKASVDGTYNDPFFVDAHTERGYQQRIRAVLQNLNRDFASVLIERGHSHQIVADSDEILDEQEDDGVRPVAIKRSAFVERIKELIHLTRGRELPGTFSPMIVTNLFMEQCHKWDVMTDKHVSDVWVAAQAFIKLVAARVADAAASKPLLEEIIEPAMKKLWTTLMVKKCELLKPHKSGHPITYNDDFSKALQKLRDDRRRTEVIDALLTCFDISSKMATDSQGYLEEGDYNFKKLVASLVKPSEPDMDRLAASEALDCMEAYYEVRGETPADFYRF